MGQTTYSYPSVYADKRNLDVWQATGRYRTPIEDDFGVEFKTYMVGGNKGEGWEALWGVKANPMRLSKNGESISDDYFQPGDKSPD